MLRSVQRFVHSVQECHIRYVAQSSRIPLAVSAPEATLRCEVARAHLHFSPSKCTNRGRDCTSTLGVSSATAAGNFDAMTASFNLLAAKDMH